MKRPSPCTRLIANPARGLLSPRALALALALSLPWACQAADAPKTYATPEAAAADLANAAKSQERDALRTIFGGAVEEIENPDRVQATNEFASFAAALQKGFRITRESEVKCVLEIGDSGWPFPIPIARQDGHWFFDLAAGKQELLNRRIGRNELAVLEVVRAYVQAQREYASLDRDGDEVLEYAQRLSSSPGLQDGLYWPTSSDQNVSPLGPMVALAQEEGYDLGHKTTAEPPSPFHGYLFKIIKRQGRHAPGGKYDYVINGNMIGGFALLAWPAEYGHSGIMSFVVNQQGVVYQKDLGTRTENAARKINAYDPDKTWRISPE